MPLCQMWLILTIMPYFSKNIVPAEYLAGEFPAGQIFRCISCWMVIGDSFTDWVYSEMVHAKFHSFTGILLFFCLLIQYNLYLNFDKMFMYWVSQKLYLILKLYFNVLMSEILVFLLHNIWNFICLLSWLDDYFMQVLSFFQIWFFSKLEF